MNKNKKSNSLVFILKLPFLVIYYIVGFVFKVLGYFCEGCYYTLYALMFPFIFSCTKIGDLLFKSYKKKEQIDLKKVAPNENVNLDSGDKEFKAAKDEDYEYQTKKEADEKKQIEEIKKKKKISYFSKKQQEKEEQECAELIKSLESDKTRSEKPVTFQYVARDDHGKKITNTFLAYSKMEVFSFLNSENYKVMSIETSKWIELLYGPSKFSSYHFKTKDLVFWLTQLSTYLKSGIPLTESVKILGKQMSKNAKKKRLFDSIIYYLTLGESFSSALQRQNNAFPPLLISMIKTAEATGELEETLDDMADYYTEIEETRKSVKSAMSYPAIITVFSFGVIAFILLYVIPQFENIYNSTGAKLNGFTLFIISASKFLQNYLIQTILVIAVIVCIIVLLYKKVKGFRIALQTIAMRMPVFGKMIIYKEMNVFAKTFSSLLRNNVFITDSMNLLSNITNNEIYKTIMFRTINNIAKGEKISSAFKDQWAVPDVAYYMIVTGESTGELAQMMSKVAEYYQTEHKAMVNTMKSFIEPAMIIFLAVVVGGIVMAIILPMFGLYSQIS